MQHLLHFFHLFVQSSGICLVYLICAKCSTGPRNTITRKKSYFPSIHGPFCLMGSIDINQMVIQVIKCTCNSGSEAEFTELWLLGKSHRKASLKNAIWNLQGVN